MLFEWHGAILTYSAENECGTTTSPGVAITVKDLPVVDTPVAPAPVCVPTPLNLTVPHVDWSNGTMTMVPGTWSLSGVGTITSTTPSSLSWHGATLTYSVENECGTTTSSGVTITVKDKPSLTTLGTPACVGYGDVLPLASIIPTVDNHNGTYTPPGTWTLVSASGSETITIASTMTYNHHGGTLTYTVENECGTTTSNTVAVCVQDIPTIQICTTLPAICAGTLLDLMSACSPTINLNGHTQVGGGSWTVTGGTYTNTNWTTPGTLSHGTYQISYNIITTPHGSVSSNTVTITVKDLPVVDPPAVPAPVCAGQPLNLTIPTIDWMSGTLTSVPGTWTLVTISAGTETITATTPMSYTWHGGTLTYSVANECGTTTSSGVTITVKDLPVVDRPVTPRPG
jgi:hypothetical protein